MYKQQPTRTYNGRAELICSSRKKRNKLNKYMENPNKENFKTLKKRGGRQEQNQMGINEKTSLFLNKSIELLKPFKSPQGNI